MHSIFIKSMLRARVPAGVFLGSGLVAGGVVVGMQSPALCGELPCLAASGLQQPLTFQNCGGLNVPRRLTFVLCRDPTGTGNSEYWDGQLAARDPVGAAGRKSAAFVFIKPHAVYPKAIELVKAKFAASGIAVTSEVRAHSCSRYSSMQRAALKKRLHHLQGTLDWKTIDSKMLIDTHYGAIANRAVKQKPSELVVPEKAKVAFQQAFGLSWDSALSQVKGAALTGPMKTYETDQKTDGTMPAVWLMDLYQGLVYNAVDGCTKLGVDGAGLDKKWSKLKRGADMIKFGGGFYAGKVDGIYVMVGRSPCCCPAIASF